jgi:ribonuclease D
MEPLYAAIEKSDEVYLDVEADSNRYAYGTKLSLMQLLVEGEIWLIDAIASVPKEDFDILLKMLMKKRLVLHAADFDFRLLSDICRSSNLDGGEEKSWSREAGFQPLELFDTMLAAQILGPEKSPLGVGLSALLQHHIGITIEQKAKLQKANWLKRPLDREMLLYASLDVWYLPFLKDRLTVSLQETQRTYWHDEMCRSQIRTSLSGVSDPERAAEAWRKPFGWSKRLSSLGLASLYSVYQWRMEHAAQLDLPPYKVLSNTDLREMAEIAHSSAESVSQLPSREVVSGQGRTQNPVDVPAAAAVGPSFLAQTSKRMLTCTRSMGPRRQTLRPSLAAAVERGLRATLRHVDSESDAELLGMSSQQLHLVLRNSAGEEQLVSWLSKRTRQLPPLSTDQERQFESIRVKKDAVARSLGIDGSVLASRDQIERYVRQEEQLGEVFMKWQADLLELV